MVSLKPKGVTDPESDIDEDIERMKSKWTSKEVSCQTSGNPEMIHIYVFFLFLYIWADLGLCCKKL